MDIYDNVSADTLGVEDQVIINGNHIEVSSVEETDDVDVLIVNGYSHDTGDSVSEPVHPDDFFDLWSV